MTWLDTIKSTLFQLSLEGKSLSKALEEWQYQGNMYDTEGFKHTCELCGHPDLRYQFEITNKHNQGSLLVGSECIKKFSGISVLDSDGNKLDVVSARKKVNSDKRSLITDAKKRDVLNSLIQLSWKDEEFKIDSFIEYFKDRGAFTPDQLATLFWRLNKHGVPFNKAYFKIIIKRDREKEQLINMPDWKLKKIWSALSTSQKSWLNGRR